MTNKRILVTESERNNILGLYGVNHKPEYVILDWLSPNEDYAIFLDELFDIKNQTKLGNIWENFDNFKFFIKHSFDTAKNIPTDIKESVNQSLNNLLLTESTQDFTRLKPFIKDIIINEGFGDWMSSAGEWLKDTAKGAISGTGDFLSKSYQGVKGLINGISQGQWSDVLNLIGKGALFVARKIRSALYNPIGLILDAILVATGIGKGAQVVIWGVVVALDIYELISGNFENKEENYLTRLLFTGIDCIGLITAGAAAKESKGIIGDIIRKFGSTSEGLSNAVKNNSVFKGILEKINSVAGSVSSKMNGVASFLEKKSPMLYKFVSSILGGLNKFIQKIIDLISGLLGIGKKVISAPGKGIEKVLGGGKLGKGAKAGFNTGAVVGALGTYGKGNEIQNAKELENVFINSNSDFDGV